MRRHALLVASAPRSGATALAAALARLGADTGRTALRPAAGEPDDTWQSAPLCALNDRLLESLGLRWDTLAALPERWRERPGVRLLAAEADQVIAGEFGDAPLAVLKDPRLALTGPFWRERLDAAGFDVSAAIVMRRPLEVSASIKRHEPFAPEKSLALWLHYASEAERGTRGVPRALVFYDRLLEAPADVLAQLVAECRLPLRLDAGAAELLRAAVRPDLKRAADARTPAAGLSSGIDVVLEDGYRRLTEQRERGDFRRSIETIAQAAYRPLMQAIPPWLGQELANARAQAERAADAHAGARTRVAALERELEQAVRVSAARDRADSQLQQRIDSLSRSNANETRDARMDASLVHLQGDLARLATTLADLPAREQTLRIELGQAQRDLADERQTISRLSETIENERSVAHAHAEKLELAQQHLQAMVTELDAARTAQAGWNDHHHALTHELDELRARLDGVLSERDGLRRERDETARQMTKLQAEFESARTDLRIVDHDRNALAARAQAVGDAATALREELARRAQAEAALVAERERLGADLRKQADRLMVVERELARRVGELQALAGRHDMLAKTLSALQQSWLGRQALAGTKRPAA